MADASIHPIVGRIPLGLALATVVAGCAHPAPSESATPGGSDARLKPYEGYFQAVKARVAKTWDPGAVLKAHDANREQFGARDRLTILEVSLDAGGAISAMQLRRSSGLAFLDEAAMDAFRRAAPFQPPPAGLLDGKGTFPFPFGFYVESPSNPAKVPPAPRGSGASDAGAGLDSTHRFPLERRDTCSRHALI